MALDLYVGPVSRYLSGDWKNLGQQAAEAAGMAYQLVGGPAKVGLIGRWQRDRAYRAWLALLQSRLVAVGDPSGLWDDAPARAYSTHRPGWEGFAGLIVVLSHRMAPGFPAPAGQVTPEALESDPAVAALSQGSGVVNLVGGCRLWVPGEFGEVVQAPFIEGDDVGIGSVGALDRALNEACRAWPADRNELERMGGDQPGPETSWEEAGRNGLSVFCQMTSFARSNRLPVILDF